MDACAKKSVNIHQLRGLINTTNNITELKALNSIIPKLSLEEEMIAHRNMDDGIYDAKGTLIGEKHPND